MTTIGALSIAMAIFIIDIYTPLGIAVAALYSVVVLLAARLATRRGILAIGVGCLTLTVLAYAIQHGRQYEIGPFMRCVGSLLTILLTTLLALKTQESANTSREQAGLLELTHDGVFVREIGDSITFWNSGAALLYGWTKEEALGQSTEKLLLTVYPLPLTDLMVELYRTGRWEGELLRTCKDGRQIAVASRWSLRRDNKSRPIAILETNNDVSERKRIEEERRQQEMELRLFIDTIPTLGWICRPDGSAEYLNKRWLDYTGLALSDALGWNWKAAFHPDDIDRMVERYQRSLATGEPFEDEGRLRRFDGTYRWLLFRAEARRDAHGEIVKWYGTNTDIEDLKSAELAVLRSQAYLDEAQRLSHTGSFAWKPANNEMVWSREAYQILGVDPSASPTIGLMFDQVHEDDRDFVKQQIKRAINGEREFDFEHRLLTRYGDLRHLHVRARRVKYASGDEEIVGALMDVTNTRRAQTALQSAQADLAHAARVATLGEISASIAHEVNQPLGAIVTLGQASQRWLQRQTPDVDEALSGLASIVSEANRAAEVIHRIRQFAKKAEPAAAKLDINELVQDVVRLVRHEALTHQVSLRTSWGDGLPAVIGDRIQLQQVVVNLMMNGLQAMAKVKDRPRVLSIQTLCPETGNVLVSVQDTGPGIGSKPSEELFAAFYTTKANGMGMGLSICRSIIEAHGGRIWANSNAGPGMTFQFIVPSNDDISSASAA
ncbi:PAS domain-containing sensor histidine kinase [Hyphomicrobium facile]|uniref:PAS domain-containing sensor histidine kinase n=1 Tax=Hyphomicrobium facile TaxID=51670 RepID=UPI0015A581FD|nr:PAS domain-containing sensor histidine kinase [Hyphomicrobium facile]